MLDVDGEQPIAVAYYQPTAATDRTWTLLMIASSRTYVIEGNDCCSWKPPGSPDSP